MRAVNRTGIRQPSKRNMSMEGVLWQLKMMKAGTSWEGRSVISPRPYILADISIVYMQSSVANCQVNMPQGLPWLSVMSASVSTAFLTCFLIKEKGNKLGLLRLCLFIYYMIMEYMVASVTID